MTIQPEIPEEVKLLSSELYKYLIYSNLIKRNKLLKQKKT
jgi:hypothetical protein